LFLFLYDKITLFFWHHPFACDNVSAALDADDAELPVNGSRYEIAKTERVGASVMILQVRGG